MIYLLRYISYLYAPPTSLSYTSHRTTSPVTTPRLIIGVSTISIIYHLLLIYYSIFISYPELSRNITRYLDIRISLMINIAIVFINPLSCFKHRFDAIPIRLNDHLVPHIAWLRLLMYMCFMYIVAYYVMHTLQTLYDSISM